MLYKRIYTGYVILYNSVCHLQATLKIPNIQKRAICQPTDYDRCQMLRQSQEATNERRMWTASVHRPKKQMKKLLTQILGILILKTLLYLGHLITQRDSDQYFEKIPISLSYGVASVQLYNSNDDSLSYGTKSLMTLSYARLWMYILPAEYLFILKNIRGVYVTDIPRPNMYAQSAYRVRNECFYFQSGNIEPKQIYSIR